MRKDIILEDTTLRDGEQAPGIAFSVEQKMLIFDRLIAVGVQWLEIGIPAMLGSELVAIKKMLERKQEANLIAWNRGVKDDIAHSIDLGFSHVHIGLPTSDIHLKNSLGKGRRWLIESATDLVKFAKDSGVFVSISAEDVGRTEAHFLQEYTVAVTDAGADRLRLSDTIGILTPEEYANRVTLARSVSEIDLQCHCHNDFGLAVANALAGLAAGARYFHVCVNGIGERAGMPDFAQMVMSLKKLYNVDLGIRSEQLTNLSHTVSTASGAPIPPWQPVVGRNVFSHESGIHANGTLKEPSTFEPFPPEDVGAKRSLIAGKHSGRASLKHLLETSGLSPTDEKMVTLLGSVREEAVRLGRGLKQDELVALYISA